MLILGLKGLNKRILSAAFDQGLTFVDGVVAGMGTWGRASANGWGGMTYQMVVSGKNRKSLYNMAHS